MTRNILLSSAVGAAASLWLANRWLRHRPRRRPVGSSARFNYSHFQDDFDEVDEASWESFPASDPPAFF